MHTSCFIADSRTVLLLLAINNIIWRGAFLHEWQTFGGAKTGQCSVLRTREARVGGGLVERDHRYQYHHDCAQSSSAAEIYPEWTSCHSDTRTSMCRDWRWLALITFKCEDHQTREQMIIRIRLRCGNCVCWCGTSYLCTRYLGPNQCTH